MRDVRIARHRVFRRGGFFVFVAAEHRVLVGLGVVGFAAGQVEAGAEGRGEEGGRDFLHEGSPRKGLRKASAARAATQQTRVCRGGGELGNGESGGEGR